MATGARVDPSARMIDLVTVAIPVRDGAQVLEATLAAVRSQRLMPGASLELLVCDSGSRDGSVGIARRFGAEVIEIAPESFSHGATRNLLMARASGAHVAFLTQDAVPAGEHWLMRLLEGFSFADDVALVFGPYRPRSGASPMVARELTGWFDSFSPPLTPRIDRLESTERGLGARALLGPLGFFTDANGAIARAAWKCVPFRPVAYAEDHVLAHDMLRAGYAKVYHPEAAVIHSHDYSSWDWVRRSFDEARALQEVYGFREPLQARRLALQIYGRVGADWRWAQEHEHAACRTPLLLARSTAHHVLRSAGAVLGARAGRLPEALVHALSLEKRG
ncbi:MAG: glycosyltransferase family 2 protein [Solirubrobacteraceae bacterium]